LPIAQVIATHPVIGKLVCRIRLHPCHARALSEIAPRLVFGLFKGLLLAATKEGNDGQLPTRGGYSQVAVFEPNPTVVTGCNQS